jgi:hypothetical protein
VFLCDLLAEIRVFDENFEFFGVMHELYTMIIMVRRLQVRVCIIVFLLLIAQYQ